MVRRGVEGEIGAQRAYKLCFMPCVRMEIVIYII